MPNEEFSRDPYEAARLFRTPLRPCPTAADSQLPEPVRRRTRHLPLRLRLLLLPIALVGCQGRRPPPAPSPSTEVIFPVDSLQLPPKLWLGFAADMVLWPARRALFVADGVGSRIIRIDLATRSSRVICATGSGPNEVRSPTALEVLGDRLWIVDSGNGRILLVSSNCADGRSFPLEARAYSTNTALGPTGMVLNPTGGFDGHLLTLHDSTGRLGSLVPVPPLPLPLSPTDLKREVARHELPQLFANNVLVAQDASEDVYVASLGAGWLRKYSRDSTLVWGTTLDDPLFTKLLEAYRAQNLNEPNPRRIHPYRLFADLELAEKDEEVWLLSSPDADSAIVWQFASGTGHLDGRLSLHGVSSPGALTVDDHGGRFFVMADNGERVFVFSTDGSR